MLRRGKTKSDFAKQRKRLVNCNALAYFKRSLQEQRAGQPKHFQRKRQLEKTLSVPSCAEGVVNVLPWLRASASLRCPDQASLQPFQFAPRLPHCHTISQSSPFHCHLNFTKPSTDKVELLEKKNMTIHLCYLLLRSNSSTSYIKS